jgi:DNA modification methylase
MRLIPADKIIIAENRQRQEFEPQALMELTESITNTGLQHAIVVRDQGEQIFLVAGERRMRAIQDAWMLGGQLRFDGKVIPEGLFPTVTLGELSELEAEEAELDENLKRKDLTWQEHAAAVERLHNLRAKQVQVAQTEAIAGGADIYLLPHTVADTAKEVRGSSEGYNQDITRKEIIVAKHLDNPLIAKAKSADEAYKILKKDEQSKKNTALAATVGLTFSAKAHTLVRGECLGVMSRTDMQNRFDVILTDPPYGIGADEFGDGGGKLAGIEHHYQDSYENWVRLMASSDDRVSIKGWCQLAYEAAKPQAHAYVFCDFDRFHELKAFMQRAGWYVFRTPLVVYKLNSGRVPLPDRGPRRQYELVLYAIKGDKPVNHIRPDVIPCQGDDNSGHGAQKPVALFMDLLQRSVKPGDEVLDCFAGSGPIFPAAHSLMVKATGIEKHPDYQGMCIKRLNDLELNDLPGLL